MQIITIPRFRDIDIVRENLQFCEDFFLELSTT